VSSTAIREAIERDEAAAAEVETPEPEPDTPEPEPEPEPQPAPPTEKELAALGKKIDAENDRHAKRLQELYGAMWADLRPCPLCDAEGHLMPIPLEERDPAQVAAVHAALGEHETPDLMPMEGVKRCPKCDGWGHVESPARNEENRIKPCLACQTRGYQEVMPGADAYPQPAAVPPPYTNGAPQPPVIGQLDQWNRPFGHPHYGVEPALVS
jgi:hypothetical protein